MNVYIYNVDLGIGFSCRHFLLGEPYTAYVLADT